MKRLYRYISASLGAMTLLAGGGCAGEDTPGGGDSAGSASPVGVSVTLSARPGNQSGTRAEGDPDGTPADPEYANEKIKDWFVVFIDNNRTVAKILQRGDSETGINVTANSAVEQETFKCILPTGTYTVYAFANITQDQLKTSANLEFPVGTQLDADFKDKIAAAVWTSELNGWNIESGAIPMSGHRENVAIKNTIEETLSIEVVRMLAKVELLFSNPTDKDITVTKISLDPVTNSSVSLFPKGQVGIDYSYLGVKAYTPLNDATYAPLSVTINSEIAKGKGTNDEEPVSASFYMKESLSARHNDNAFTVGLTVSHEDGVQEYQQYNITNDIRQYINRNDWIVIPITLSQYDVSVEALFYPPIGGYPAVELTRSPDGSQVFTFGTEGEFAIVPKVIDKITGQHLLATDYTITLGTLTGSVNIFTKAPSLTASTSMLPHEITGTLSNTTGRAVLPIEVTIGSHTYHRTIYIIRAYAS